MHIITANNLALPVMPQSNHTTTTPYYFRHMPSQLINNYNINSNEQMHLNSFIPVSVCLLGTIAQNVWEQLQQDLLRQNKYKAFNLDRKSKLN